MNKFKLFSRKPKIRSALVVYTAWQGNAIGSGSCDFTIIGKLSAELIRAMEATLCDEQKFTRAVVTNIIWLEV
jgi:hypothetical protein